MRRILLRIPLLITLLTLCHSLTAQVEVGADQIEQILTYTAGKRVALTVNHTSVLSNPQHTHLVDTLLAKGVQVTQLFTPEHGLRGTADDGAAIR
ncbi:exo-beta-N-acetylmuramidase NamZ domain-containing protein, partial [uncultured Porphyromonas sp.]|uniref:exo-beta-N-acetylmuramidase NamZ domain-containing protein n=1 Tax=uncultured Porphyromonas sp. TaxID=159274 RepID=UPI002608FB89